MFTDSTFRPVVEAAVADPDDVRLVMSDVLGGGSADRVDGGEALAWNEPAVVLYTSGTTGPSKGALLT